MSGIELMQLAMQAPMQHTSVPVQAVSPHLHWPATQVAPSPQEWPQLPQLRMSVMRLAQPALGQQVWSFEQGAPDGKQPQWPPMQTVPPVQAALQPPQLFAIDLGVDAAGPQQVPWQLAGWPGQMPPLVPPMSFLVPDGLSLQPATVIKIANNRRIQASPNGRTVPRTAVAVKGSPSGWRRTRARAPRAISSA